MAGGRTGAAQGIMGAGADVLHALAGQAPPSRYIRAYHGSPHDFDAFDASKIGTGEGNQAYGYGLYFAQNENVADAYRSALSGPYSAALAPADDLPRFFAPGNVVPSFSGKDKVLQFIPGPEGEPWRWSVEVIAVDNAGNPKPYERPRIHRTHPSLKAADAFFGREPRRPGRGYEVEIGHPEEALLDYDAPISRQPKIVQKLFGDFAMDRPGDGGRIYRDIATRHGEAFDDDVTGVLANLEASKELLSEGIPGVRYLDQHSRGIVGQGTRNYVMFPGTEDQIRILRKHGLLAPMAAGAMEED